MSDRARIDRIVFFGTPSFAVPTADALTAAGRRPVLVVSQPSRPRGRGRRPEPPPVAWWARSNGVDLAQPRRVAEPEFLERLHRLDPDLAVVVAFGQIFRRELLELPRLGCVNLHASLLPAYRGAAPIAAAIRAGERRTGVTTMLMDEGLDTGPMLLRRELEIGPGENAAELGERLARLGAELMVETVAGLERGEIEPQPQDHARATVAPRLVRDDGKIDWRRPALRIHDLVRAMSPWPGAFTHLRGEPLKIHRTRVLEPERLPEPQRAVDGPAGVVLGRLPDALAVSCGDGSVLALLEVQRPGRRACTGADLYNGERLARGERLGEEAGEPAVAIEGEEQTP